MIDFTLTPEDLADLDTRRINRLREYSPSLLSVKVVLIDGRLFLICAPDQQLALEKALPRLSKQAYILCGAVEISLYCNHQLINTLETCNKLKKHPANFSKFNGETMTSATLTKTEVQSAQSTTSSATANQSIGLSQIVENLAQKTGQTPEAIAIEILNKLPIDVAMPAIQQHVDNFLEQDFIAYQEQKRKEFLGIGKKAEGSASTTTPSATNGAATAEAKEAKTKRIYRRRSMSFKGFEPARNSERTLGNFLKAQGWDEAKRIEVIEAIASLSPEIPTQPEALETLPEQAMKKILSLSKNTRKAIISAAQKMKGQPSEPSSEPAETTTEE